MQAASVTTTSTVAPDHELPSAHARDRDELLRRREPDARRHDARARRADRASKRATSRSGLRSLNSAIATTWSAARHRACDAHGHRHRVAVVDELRDVERDASRGAAARRRCSARIAASSSSGAAAAGRTSRERDSPRAQRAASWRRGRRPRRHRFSVPSSATTSSTCCASGSGFPRHAAPTRASPSTRWYAGMIVAGIQRAGSSTMRRRSCAGVEPRAHAGEVGREVALEALLRERPGVAQQAHADLPVRDDRAAARRHRRACR